MTLPPLQPSLFGNDPVIDHQKPGDIRRRSSLPAARPKARAALASGNSSSSGWVVPTPAEVERTRALTEALFRSLRAEGLDPSSPDNVRAFRDELLDQLCRSDPDRTSLYRVLLLPEALR